MIGLSHTSSLLANSALNSKGGFTWWYLDLIDKHGNGAVIIWSFGLPFLPEYASKARNGVAVEAKTRPSLNISLYQNFKPSFYLLQEYEPHSVTWQENRWIFGDNHFHFYSNPTQSELTLNLSSSVPQHKHPLTNTREGQVR